MRTFKIIFYASLALSCLLGWVFPIATPHFAWHHIPVFDALFGFAGCAAIIVVSKALGHRWLQKKEDYYD